MGALMEGLLQEERRRRRVAALVVAALFAGVATWLSLPFGIVLLIRGEWIGALLVAFGVVSLTATGVAIVAARRARRPPESLPGKPNPRFGEPEPSRNPRGGYSMVGSQIGSH